MFKKVWHRISNNGIDDTIEVSEQKRIKISNQLLFFAICFTGVFSFIYSYLGLLSVNVIEYSAIGFYLILVLLYNLKYITLARTLFVIILNVHMFLLSISFGIESQMQLLFIPVAALPVVVYNPKKIHYLIGSVLLSIVLFSSLYFFQFDSPVDATLPSELFPKMRFIFNITAIVCEVIVIYAIISNYDRNEQKLDENNELLQQQLQAIFENSFDAMFLVEGTSRKIIKANNRAIELFQMDSEEEFKSTFGTEFHKQQPTAFELEKTQKALNTVGVYKEEILYKTKKGNEFWGALAIKMVEIGLKKYQSVRVTDITIEKKAKAHMEASLQEKELLLSEIHHRVKNNMAVISGLLGLQSSYVENEGLKLLFEESRNRIHSMALIHDKLYQHETFARIDFNAYCNDLVNYIRSSYNDTDATITYSISCNDVFIDIKNAVPCGLIVNELISNSYKHAFKGRENGEIKIVCTQMGGKFTMMVSDNGIGFESEKILEQPVSLGLTLISALVDQVSGTIKVSGKEGTTYYISFEE